MPLVRQATFFFIRGTTFEQARLVQSVTHDQRGVAGAIDGIGQLSLEKMGSGNVTRPQLGSTIAGSRSIKPSKNPVPAVFMGAIEKCRFVDVCLRASRSRSWLPSIFRLLLFRFGLL